MFSSQGYKVFEFDKLTRTAQEAADALGCELGQIAKSVLFKSEDGNPILVITSGSNKVDVAKVSTMIGKELLKADADFVKEKSGFVIGGVPPWGHKIEPIILIDQSLLKYGHIFAAAGKNNAVFQLTFDDLVAKTSGKVMVVA